jgi:hypothetical protein
MKKNRILEFQEELKHCGDTVYSKGNLAIMGHGGGEPDRTSRLFGPRCHLMNNQHYVLLSLNSVFPFTHHEIPNANSATDSNISTGFIAAIKVPRKKIAYILMHTIATNITIPQER